ncbi:MAG TPA: winged helix-turn-helix domain-containing protein [Pyrinomonadaceae bacterium]|jgi:DNA-binding transcriptional ArsR family regulator|nr:winged helix-turn-helix domain-containing protein [Pyrinomonadaceae bacterium]
MNNSNNSHQLLFPCECVSARTDNYSDPWAPISRNRLLVDGTKEEILNLVADEPKTISQLARSLNLSAPSIHKHINELLDSELLRDSKEWEKLHPKERYYEPNFPVVDAANCAEMEKVCGELSNMVADAFVKALPKFERAFKSSGLPEKGWDLKDLSQCLYARIQRTARRTLEERGVVVKPNPHRNGVAWSFWAEKQRA